MPRQPAHGRALHGGHRRQDARRLPFGPGVHASHRVSPGRGPGSRIHAARDREGWLPVRHGIRTPRVRAAEAHAAVLSAHPAVCRPAGQKLTDQILQLNGNINDNINDNRGTGGTCFGDSGGPTFLGGYVVTVTSYTYTANCRYLGGYQRVDILGVQKWPATFGVRPAAA